MATFYQLELLRLIRLSRQFFTRDFADQIGWF